MVREQARKYDVYDFPSLSTLVLRRGALEGSQKKSPSCQREGEKDGLVGGEEAPFDL